MLPETHELLRHPYEQGEPPSGDAYDHLAERIGVPTPHIRSLERLIFQDLDPERFGIGWWKEQLDPPRRILIADQLLLDTSSVPTNLVEATLHRLGAEQAWQELRARFRDHVRQGRPPGAPVPRSPVDELPYVSGDLHVAGVFRAVGSALDCLAGTLIGVAALPRPILKADFDRTHHWLAEHGNRHPEWERLAEHLDAVIDQAGPSGWLKWAVDMRNMLVHRGRRLTMIAPYMTQYPTLIVPPSVIADRTEVAHLLPRDPGRSEVEVLRDTQTTAGLMLTEDGAKTLIRLVESTIRVVEETSTHLVGLWQRRRADPALLAQPTTQWQEITASRSPGFAGYYPDSAGVIDSGQLHVNPQLGQRMRAAALLNDQRHLWATWTAT